MSRTIDERVVKMEFDNAQFEKGVKQTRKSLKELKESLKLEESARQMEEFTRASSGFAELDFTKISDALQTITNRFSVMGQIGATVIQNLTNKFTNFATATARSLTLDQVTSGFSKYEQKMTSTRTIMNAGYNMPTVEKYMAKLQKYTDETSYRFSEMIGAISSFTSAGVQLSVAETAVEGIANACALAGKGAGEANIAFTNFSQAISKGTMKLDDWKSLQNLGIDTVQLKQAFMDAAADAKVLTKETKKLANGQTAVKYKFKGTQITTANFAQTLSKGWLNANIMNKALSVFADNTQGVGKEAYKSAQEARTFTDAMDAVKESISSGWSTTWEKLFGNVTQASELWTGFCNALIDFLYPVQEVRNELLGLWAGQGGKDDLLAGIKNLWQVICNVRDVAGQAAEALGFEIDERNLLQITQDFRNFTEEVLSYFNLTEKLIPKKKTGLLFQTDDEGKSEGETVTVLSFGLQYLKKTLIGVGAAAKIVWSFVSSLWSGFTQLLTILQPLGDTIFSIVGDIGMWIKDLSDWIDENKIFQNAIDGVVAVLKPIIEKIAPALKKAWTGLKKSLNDNGFFNTVKAAFSDFFGKIPGWFQSAVDFFKGIWKWFQESETLKKWGEQIGAAFQVAIGWLGEKWQAISTWLTETGANIANFFQAEQLKKNWDNVQKWFIEKWNIVKPYLDQIWETVSPFIETVKQWCIQTGTNVWNAIAGFFANPAESFQKVGQDIAAFFANPGPFIAQWWESAKAWGASIWEKIKSLFTPGQGEGGQGSKSSIGEWFSIVKNKVVQFFGKIVEFVSGLFGKKGQGSEVLSQVQQSGKEIKKGQTVFEWIGSLIDSTWGWVKQHIWPILQDIGTFAVQKILPFVAIFKIASIPKAVNGIVNSFGSVIDKIHQAPQQSEGDKAKKKAQSWLMIAGAIALIAGAIYVIGNMELQKCIQGGIAIVLIGGLVLGMMAIAKKINKQDTDQGKSLMETGIGFLAMTASLILLALAADMYGKILQDGNALKGLGLATVMLVALAGIAGVLSKFGGSEGSWQAGVTVLAIAAALILVAYACKPLGDIPPDKFAQIILSITLLGGIFAVIAWVVTKGSTTVKRGQKYKSIGKTMLAIAIAMWVVVQAVMPFAKLSDTEFLKAGAAMAVLLGCMIAIIAVINAVIKNMKDVKTGQLLSFALIIAAVAAMAVGISFAITMIKDVDTLIVVAFLAGIVGIIVALKLAITASSNLSWSQTGMLLALMAVIALMGVGLSYAIKQLEGVDWPIIAAFMAGMALMLGVLALVAPIMKSITPKEAAYAAISVALIGAAIVLVAWLAGKAITSTIKDLAVALQIFGPAMTTFCEGLQSADESKWKQAQGILNGLKDIATSLVTVNLTNFYNFLGEMALCGAQMKTTMSFFEQSGLDSEKAESIKESIEILASMVSSSKIPTVEQAQNFRSAIGYIQFAIADLPTISDCIAKFTITLLDVIRVHLILNEFGRMVANPTATTQQAETFRTYVGKLSNAATSISSFVTKLNGITPEAIQNANSIISGIAGTAEGINLLVAMEDDGRLEKLGSALTTFSGAIAIYKTALQDDGLDDLEVPDGTTKNLNTEAVVGFLQQVAERVGQEDFTSAMAAVPDKGNFDTFAAQLAALGLAIQAYDEAVRKVNPISMLFSGWFLTLVSDIHGKLTQIEALGNKLGVENVMGSFATNIEYLGGAMQQYITDIAGADAGKITASGYFLSLVTDIYGKLIPIRAMGLILGGTNILGGFANNIKDLGTAMHDYGKAVDGIPVLSVIASGIALDMMAGLYKRLTDIQQVIQSKLGGSIDPFFKFNTNVTNLGGALSAYWTSIKDIDYVKATGSVSVLNMLADLYSALPLMEGAMQFVFGHQDLTRFAGEVGLVGTQIQQFCTDTAGITNIQGALNAVQVMTGLGKILASLPETGGWLSAFTGDQTLISVVQDLAEVVTPLTQFIDGFKDLNLDNASNAEQAVDILSTILTPLVNTNGQQISNLAGDLSRNSYKVNGQNMNVIGVLNWFVSELGKNVDGTDLAMEKVNGIAAIFSSMVSLLDYFDEGFYSDTHANIVKNINELTPLLSSINWNGIVNSGITSGATFDTGFVQGMTSDEGTLPIITALSTITTKITAYEDQNHVFANAGSYLGNLFAAAIIAEVDTTPTITPVLDLSQLTQQASTIPGLLNGQNGISMAGSTMALASQNSTVTVTPTIQENNSRLIAAMEDLKSNTNTAVNRIGAMYVRLDTNALVGQITSKLDAALGRIVEQKMRDP